MYPNVHCSAIYNSQDMEAVPIYNGILLSRTNLVRWINLEPVIQSEVSQKKKNKYCILMHIYGIWKNCTDELTFREGIET